MRAFIGLTILSAVATLAVLWLLPPTGSFAVKAQVVN